MQFFGTDDKTTVELLVCCHQLIIINKSHDHPPPLYITPFPPSIVNMKRLVSLVSPNTVGWWGGGVVGWWGGGVVGFGG